jgi:hypothetical protein
MNKTNLGRVLFVLTITALACALYLLLSAPALAFNVWEPSFGEKGTYTLYDGTEYDDGLENAVAVMNAENERFGGRGVEVVITDDPAQADTLVIDTHRGATGYGGVFWGPARFQPDEVRLNVDRLERYGPLVVRMVVLHELFHSFGFGHVECEYRSIVNSGCNRKPVDHLRKFDHRLYRTYIVEGGI